MTIAPNASAVMGLRCPSWLLDADSCLSFPKETLGMGLKMVSCAGVQAKFLVSETTLCLSEPVFPTLVVM